MKWRSSRKFISSVLQLTITLWSFGRQITLEGWNECNIWAEVNHKIFHSCSRPHPGRFPLALGTRLTVASQCAVPQFTEVNSITIERFRVTFTAKGKRQIQVDNFSKWNYQPIKTVQNNSFG